MSEPKDLSSSGVTFELATHTLQRALPEYRIVREIGAGSMGTVFEAIDTNLNRRVAIKVLPPSASSQDTRRLRFKREVEAIARLTHPNIVPIYTVGSAAGLHYFVMGFIGGGSLADALKSHGAYPALKAFRMMRQIVLAVQEAHRLGVIHRDIKPGNLLVDGDEKLILTDFGLARPEGTETMTETGAIVGTPMYMAPEQILGEKSKIDGRCDLYAVGATLYQMLTASMPFTGESTTAVLRAVLEKAPLPFSRGSKQVPRDAQKIVLKLLHKDPADRYRDAAALLLDIDRLLDGEPVEATLPGVVTRVQRSVRRHPIASSIVVGVAVVACILLFGQSRLNQQKVEKFQIERDKTSQEMQEIQRHNALTTLSDEARAVESDVGSTWTYAGKIDAAIERALRLFQRPEAEKLFHPETKLTAEEAQVRASIASRIHPFLSALFYYRALSDGARDGDLDQAHTVCAQGLAFAPDEVALKLQDLRVRFTRDMVSIRTPGDFVKAYSELIGALTQLPQQDSHTAAYRAFGLEFSTRFAEAMLERPAQDAGRAQIEERASRGLNDVLDLTASEAANPMQADPLILRERARALLVSTLLVGTLANDQLAASRQKEAEQLIELVRDRMPAEPHTQALRARILERSGENVAKYLKIGAGVASQLGGSAIEVGVEAATGIFGTLKDILPKLEKRPSPPPEESGDKKKSGGG